MSGKTGISWTDMSWNPVTGCTRVTEGCRFCYAFALHDQRYTAALRGKHMPAQYQKPFSEIQLLPQRLEDPLRIKTPQKIFVNSMSDLFHSQVPDDYIKQIFDVMTRAHWHTFQILTKRPGCLRRLGQQLTWAPNIWMGVSIELDSLTKRADALREVPAALRFLSCEPLLGPLPSLNLDGIHWVITGSESGRGARPMNDNWVRAIRDQCTARHIAFFFKQRVVNGKKFETPELDGKQWKEFPQIIN
jgi:protein gp37